MYDLTASLCMLELAWLCKLEACRHDSVFTSYRPQRVD